MNYTDWGVTVKEIPEEVSLYHVIAGCPNQCTNCHSQYTWNPNAGKELTIPVLDRHIRSQLPGVSCILFMGGDWNPEFLEYLLLYIRQNFDCRTALYSGQDLAYLRSSDLLYLCDFVKTGRYEESLGGLNDPRTNQRLYALENGLVKEDITYKFWEK